MFKKIILSVVATATLSTSVSALSLEEIKINVPMFDKGEKYLPIGYCYQDSLSEIKEFKQVQFARADASAKYYNKEIGTYSNSKIARFEGVGIQKNISWKNIALNYDEFLCGLSNTERTSLMYFLHARAGSYSMESYKNDYKINEQLLYSRADNLMFVYEKTNKHGVLNQVHFLNLITNLGFAENLIDEDSIQKDKNLQRFFSAIVSKDYTKAKKIISDDERTSMLQSKIKEFYLFN